MVSSLTYLAHEEQLPDMEGKVFLASGATRGIGLNMAKRIVDKFGKDALDVIEENPEALLSINGLGPKTVEKIAVMATESREFTKIAYLEYGICLRRQLRYTSHMEISRSRL